MLSPELSIARRGKLTASVAAVVMGKDNTDGLKQLVRYLAGERVFGDLCERGVKTKWMARGDEEENKALDWFELQTDITLLRQQHIDHPLFPMVAATPDGLKPKRFTVEGKCPSWAVYCDTVEAVHLGNDGLNAVPSEYRWQCRWQPWCCDLREGKFVAWHPAGGGAGQGVIVPYEITQAECDQMAERVIAVESMVRNWVDILRAKKKN